MAWCPAVWNVLHDGTIARVSGNLPGDLRLDIEIDYLRRRFEEPGQFIVLTLTGCTRMTFVPWAEGSSSISDPADVGGMGLEILSDRKESFCCVHGDGGSLEVVAQSAHLWLDDGRHLSLEELLRVSEAYWDEWEADACRRTSPDESG
jgi:hypothetical protein